MSVPLRSWCLAIAAAQLIGPVCNADVAVSAGGSRSYTGTADIDGDSKCSLSIEIERTQFVLLAVGGKYRLLRMRASCSGMRKLELSSSADKLVMTIKGKEIPGILSLQRSDGALWDSLDQDMHRTLAYPTSVEPNRPVYLFAYFPAADVADWPDGFSYAVASLGRAVSLDFRPTAARN